MQQLIESDRDVEIVWRAFELRPEPVPQIEPQGDYLKTVWLNSVYPLAEQLGLNMRLPPVKPRSRLAHEAAHWARSVKRFDDYHAQIFRAYFERGEDIGAVDVLVKLADEIGLDSHLLQQSLTTHEFLHSVLTDERAADAIGVRGVPAFIANRKAALSGVQPVENLKRWLTACEVELPVETTRMFFRPRLSQITLPFCPYSRRVNGFGHSGTLAWSDTRD